MEEPLPAMTFVVRRAMNFDARLPILQVKGKDSAAGRTASSSLSHGGTTKATSRPSTSLSAQQASEPTLGASSHPPQTPLTKVQPMPGVPNTRKDHRRNSSRFNVSRNRELIKLPPLKDAAANERESLFIQKLQQCCAVYDFQLDPLSDLKWKEIKRAALNEMIDFITSNRGVITDFIYPDAVTMVGRNVDATTTQFSLLVCRESLSHSAAHIQLIGCRLRS